MTRVDCNKTLNKCLVSIIVPAYNVEKYIGQCLLSLINQTYDNLEILIINDGSTDGTRNIIKEISILDSRVKIIDKKNGGLSSARNKGLDMACGDYILFVDSDDWLEINAVKELVSLAYINNYDIVRFGCYLFDGNYYKKYITNDSDCICDNGPFLKKMMLDEIGSQSWFALYRRYLWNNIRYPDGRLYEDIPTTYKAYINANTIYFTNKCYYYYRKNLNSISYKKNRLKSYHIYLGFTDRLPFVRKNFPEILDDCVTIAYGFALSSYFKYLFDKSKNGLDVKTNTKLFLIENRRRINPENLIKRRKILLLCFDIIYCLQVIKIKYNHE